MSEIHEALKAHRYVYVPYSTNEVDKECAYAAAQFIAQHHGEKLAIVTSQRSDVDDVDYIDTSGGVTTNKYGSAPSNQVTLAWLPNRRTMSKHIYSRNQKALVLVEEIDTPLNAWARVVGAFNLDTEEVMSHGFSSEAHKALSALVFSGNRGWKDECTRRQALRHLQELDALGEYDRALVAEWMRALGRYNEDHSKRFGEVLDSFETSR